MFILLNNPKGSTLVWEVFANWVALWGFPQAIHTDNQSNIVNGEFVEYVVKNGVTLTTCAPDNHAQNAKVDRLLRYLQQQMKVCKAVFPVHEWSDSWGEFSKFVRLRYKSGRVGPNGLEPITT